MTSLFIDEVAQYLEVQGIGIYSTDNNRNLFIGNLPDQPDTAVGVFDTTGGIPEIEIPLFMPSFQVIVRAAAIDVGETLVAQIRTALHNQYNLTFISNGTYVYNCNLTAQGGHIGRDDKGRDTFSLNFHCRVR